MAARGNVRSFRNSRVTIWARTGTMTVVAALLAVVLASPAQASVSVTLQPMGGTSVSQGRPFEFEITLENTGGMQEIAAVEIELVPLTGGEPVTFAAADVLVAAGETKAFIRRAVTSQWFPEIGAFEITAMLDGAPAASLAFEVTPPTVTPPTFADVTGASGISVNVFEAEVVSCAGTQAQGAAWADADLDGDLDLFVPDPDPTQPSMLWSNDGAGHFVDRAAQAGVTNLGSKGKAAVFADYDNDGDPDLYVVNTGPNRLYRNNGDRTFTDVTAGAGVGDAGRGTSASWGDFDNDGNLDLYVVNYTECDGSAGPDKLYRNNGDGTFTDVTSMLEGDPDIVEDGSTLAAGFQAAWFDYDRDGDVDLYLGNDTFPYPENNHLWRNDGPDGLGGWLFTDVSIESGTALRMGAMGLGVGDLEADGDLDFTISNMTGAGVTGNVAFRNNGNGTFTDVAHRIGVERPYQVAGIESVTWGMVFNDFNLDGSEDLYAAAGSTIMLEDTLQPNEMFVNAGTGRFLDLSAVSGADDDRYSRAPVLADLDRDGRMDMFLLNQNGPSVLFRNVTATSGHWLEIDTVGTVSNRDGCGAVVSVKIGSATRVRQVFCGSVGFASGSDPTVHFGLGQAATADKVTIKWPSGAVQTLLNVTADRLLVATEPSA
jgi:hypothetical protein